MAFQQYDLIFGLSPDDLNSTLEDFFWIAHSQVVQAHRGRLYLYFTYMYVSSYGYV